MISKSCKIRSPHRINGILVLVVSSDPALERLACFAGWHFDCVVGKAKSHSSAGKRVEDIYMVPLNSGMVRAAIHVKENRVGVIERGRIFGPAIQIKR